MVDEQPIEVITIWPGKNLWSAPSWASSFGVEWEGTELSGDELKRRHQIVARRRNGWSPEADGWRQLQEITNAIVRRRILVKLWDPIIVMLYEDDGPYPITGFCTGVETRLDDTGALQAYLRLEHPQVIPNLSGYDQLEERASITEDGSASVNLGDLHEIQVLPLLVGSWIETREA